jgi:hypothetical protein
MAHVITPRKAYKTWHRHELTVSDEDHEKTGRGRWTAIVTDQNSGLRYKLRGASCGLPRCFCDAVVIEELGCLEIAA